MSATDQCPLIHIASSRLEEIRTRPTPQQQGAVQADLVTSIGGAGAGAGG